MQYFEVTISCTKMQDDGIEKKVKEVYLVDAMTFTEAEARMTEHAAKFYKDFSVEAEKKTPYGEVVNIGNATRFYSVRVSIITMDDSGKEKKTPVYYMVEAFSVDDADERMREELDKTMLDYQIVKVQETKIIEVINHE